MQTFVNPLLLTARCEASQYDAEERKRRFAIDRSERDGVFSKQARTSEAPAIAVDVRPLHAKCDFGHEVRERRNQTPREAYGIANLRFWYCTSASGKPEGSLGANRN